LEELQVKVLYKIRYRTKPMRAAENADYADEKREKSAFLCVISQPCLSCHPER
jgi:hypothetical protein